jgi:hypothetical protein
MTLSTEDRLDIHELYGRYCQTRDSGDVEGWLDCFSENAIFATPMGRFTGLSEIREYAEKPVDSNRHWVGNIVIYEEAGAVKGSCYLQLVQPKVGKILITGIYHDTLTKTSKGWCFSHREIEIDN